MSPPPPGHDLQLYEELLKILLFPYKSIRTALLGAETVYLKSVYLPI
jgi:hypothetical protein